MKFNNILIVDDSATSRMIIKRCFEIAGCEQSCFFERGDGIEAISFLKENSVDLIVTDLNMPKLDGVNMIRKLKIIKGLAHIPVIVISSLDNEALAAALEDLGVMGLIKKPLSPAAVSTVISK